MLGHERRPVLLSCVDPTEEEVVVTIGNSLGLEEEVLGSFFIELGSSTGAKRHVNNVEVSVLGILDPVSELVPLDGVYRPVPGVLGLYYIQLSFKT